VKGNEPEQVNFPQVRLGKSPSDCWEWLGPRNAAGYGKKTFRGQDTMAHRWIWRQLFGPIPEGLVIDHMCQNPGCVNPHHLRACTQAENVRAGLTTILTSRDVAEIRRLRANDWTAAQIAAKFCVDVSTVKSIIAGKSWRRSAKKFFGPSPTPPIS
jgi:hypothetical protein